MNLIPDTNILVRAVLGDHAKQSQAARHALGSADRVVLSIHALCEMVWVLSRSYKLPNPEISAAIVSLVDSKNVIVDNPAVEAGLKAMGAGGDFADGVVAYEGRWLGGEIFVSFDKKAVALEVNQGHAARLLG